jgi:putative N6-adenine-specific DNA methylase
LDDQLRHQCFAVSAPGIEHLLADELRALGVRAVRTQRGGVTFDASTRQMYLANAWLRTATRVLERVARFRATDFAQLERGVDRIPWDRWRTIGTPIALRVTARRSRLYHTGAIAERVRRVTAGPGSSPSSDDDLLVVVRVAHDTVSVSIDTSGAPLYKRGWRQTTTRATMRETLAAAMLLESGWNGTEPLVDPFCGSGTIAIEGALLAGGQAPGAHRRFAFERWPSFQPGTWASVRADLARARAVAPSAPIVATDRDDGAVAVTKENARRAGVASLIDVRRQSISDLVNPTGGRGWMITEPPFGRRLSRVADLRDLYARFGDVARAALDDWGVGVLAADTRVAGHARLGLRERFRTDTGGIPVHYLVGRVGDPAVAS